jgi:hypothetical protein
LSRVGQASERPRGKKPLASIEPRGPSPRYARGARLRGFRAGLIRGVDRDVIVWCWSVRLFSYPESAPRRSAVDTVETDTVRGWNGATPEASKGPTF